MVFQLPSCSGGNGESLLIHSSKFYNSELVIQIKLWSPGNAMHRWDVHLTLQRCNLNLFSKKTGVVIFTKYLRQRPKFL